MNELYRFTLFDQITRPKNLEIDSPTRTALQMVDGIAYHAVKAYRAQSED